MERSIEADEERRREQAEENEMIRPGPATL
jgi:hypothetical protein